jgi:hypothetical protein
MVAWIRWAMMGLQTFNRSFKKDLRSADGIVIFIPTVRMIMAYGISGTNR